MMTHHFRISATQHLALVERSLAAYQEMKDHLESCTVCDDEVGVCAIGQEIWSRAEAAQKQLKRLGIE